MHPEIGAAVRHSTGWPASTATPSGTAARGPLPSGRRSRCGRRFELRLSACREELERLAALSERPLHEGDWIVADVDGVPVAAVSVDDGTTVYDPFRPSVPGRVAATAHGEAGSGDRVGMSRSTSLGASSSARS